LDQRIAALSEETNRPFVLSEVGEFGGGHQGPVEEWQPDSALSAEIAHMPDNEKIMHLQDVYGWGPDQIAQQLGWGVEGAQHVQDVIRDEEYDDENRQERDMEMGMLHGPEAMDYDYGMDEGESFPAQSGQSYTGP
jgi:hypothetical protein